MPYKNFAERKALGICRACHNPRFVNEHGKLLVYCKYHSGYNRAKAREDWLQEKAKWGGKPYSPVARLLSMSAYKSLPRESLAYAAGIIEGEGWIGPNCSGPKAKRPMPSIRVKMTDEEPVRWLQALFGGNVVTLPEVPPRRRAWLWRVHGRRAGAIAAAVVEFMRAHRKRKACLLVVKAASICGWWRMNQTIDQRGRDTIAKVKASIKDWTSYGYRA